MEQMKRIKNVFVTGERGVGKSTIVSQVIKELDINPVGFRTLPYYIEGTRQGFYLAGFVNVEKYKNNTPISVQVGSDRCIGVTETFETLGVEILDISLQDKSTYLVMDELGKLERDAKCFQEKVFECLDSPQIILGVLKRCEAPFIQKIREHQDTLVLEVSKENRMQILTQIIRELERNNKYV